MICIWIFSLIIRQLQCEAMWICIYL